MNLPKSNTPGPWAWQRFGSQFCLTGQYGMRPIVLSKGHKGLTSLVDGLLVPLDPNHPDARLIATAPELLATLSKLILVMDGTAGVAAWTMLPEFQKAKAAWNKAEGRAA